MVRTIWRWGSASASDPDKSAYNEASAACPQSGLFHHPRKEIATVIGRLPVDLTESSARNGVAAVPVYLETIERLVGG